MPGLVPGIHAFPAKKTWMAGTSPAMTVLNGFVGDGSYVMETWVSALAAILTTAAFVPQALHIIRHRETKAISLVMYLAFATGVAFWFLFGFLIDNWPIMISNAITFALTAAIVAMKIRYG
jgi:MtN3 and saliva related transmembrane protein